MLMASTTRVVLQDGVVTSMIDRRGMWIVHRDATLLVPLADPPVIRLVASLSPRQKLRDVSRREDDTDTPEDLSPYDVARLHLLRLEMCDASQRAHWQS